MVKPHRTQCLTAHWCTLLCLYYLSYLDFLPFIYACSLPLAFFNYFTLCSSELLSPLPLNAASPSFPRLLQRAYYDRTGHESVSSAAAAAQAQRASAARYYQGPGGYYEEFDPAELFNMFFFGWVVTFLRVKDCIGHSEQCSADQQGCIS